MKHALPNVSRKFNVRVFKAWLPVVALLILFAALAEDVVEREQMRFDDPILLWFHAHATPSFDKLMLAITWLGGAPLLVASAFVLAALWRQGKRTATTFWGISLVGAGALNVVGKVVFQRARPDLWLSISPEYDYGFPSGHSMISCAFVLALLVLIWGRKTPIWVKWAVSCVGVLFALGVGLSRLYLGVHYPSDVMAGWALSGAWIAALYKVITQRRNLFS
ncbi:phosphatase PAP2 family protein [bacterium]|nr:MAG: phosphatase PAP2 family protein [bacterium]